MKTNKEHLANFYLAGATYYDLALCFQELHIGTQLIAQLDTNNKYDERAIAIYYQDYKIGYIPRTENRIFYKLLTLKHTIFEIRIQQINPTEHPERQIRMVAHLIENTNP